MYFHGFLTEEEEKHDIGYPKWKNTTRKNDLVENTNKIYDQRYFKEYKSPSRETGVTSFMDFTMCLKPAFSCLKENQIISDSGRD